jgi:hypothetical protein
MDVFFIAQESTSWIEIFIYLLVFFFIAIGPIIKKVTEGMRKKVAKDRGVEQRKDDESKPTPTTPEEVAVNIFEEIAGIFEKKAAPPVEPKRPQGAPPRLTQYEPHQTRRKSRILRQKPERREPPPRAVPVFDLPVEPVKTKDETHEAFVKKVETIGVGPEEIKSVGAISAVKAVHAKSGAKKTNLLTAMPARLTGNQRAILLAEILGPPRYTNEQSGLWEYG